MTLATLFLLTFSFPENVSVLTTYAEPPEPEYLGTPYSMGVSHEGKLYVADSGQGRILVWNKDGTFYKAFGSTGEGPGELNGIAKITLTDDAVYVLEERRQISIFDLEGKFKKSIKIPFRARCFGVLDNDRYLFGVRNSSAIGGGTITMGFELYDAKTEERTVLNEWPNESILTQVQGDNNFHVKAYGPELDIQTGPEGLIYYGFSQNKTIYRMDRTGKVLGSEVMPLLTSLPDEIDTQINEAMTLPGPNGTRVQPSKLPNLKIHYEYEKAYYTHFLVLEDTITFVLTPLGGTDRSGNGFAKASYYVYDRKKDSVVKRGRYNFPEDSVVLYRDGHAVLFSMNEEDGNYGIQKINLTGM